MVASSNVFGRIRKTLVNEFDRATNLVNADGVGLTKTYDAVGRVVVTSYPDGGNVGSAYSARGVVRRTNQLDKVTAYGYDEAGRKTSVTNSNNEVTSFTYDAAGSMLSVTDGEGQTTTWTYDEYSRPTNKVDATSSEMFRYSYDANGRMTNQWTPEKGNVKYSYDAVGNQTQIDYPVSFDITFAYDAADRITNMTDEVGTTRWTNDSAGRVQSIDGPWSDDTLTLAYNKSGQRISLTLSQPNRDDWSQSYEYDGASRLDSLASPAGTFDYRYAYKGSAVSAGRLIDRIQLPSGSLITNSHDSVGRLSETRLVNSSSVTLNKHTYEYDLAGQRTKQTFAEDNYVEYSYD